MKLLQKMRAVMHSYLMDCEMKGCSRKGTLYREFRSKRYRPFGFALKWICQECAHYLDNAKKYEPVQVLTHDHQQAPSLALPIQ